MVKTIKIPRGVIQNGRRIQGTAFLPIGPRFAETIFFLPAQSFFTKRAKRIGPWESLRADCNYVFVKNKVILRGQKTVSRENQKIIRFGAEKSGGGWSLSLQWRHDTWNAFTVLFKRDAIKQFEPLKSLGNTKCFQSVALEFRVLNEEVQR